MPLLYQTQVSAGPSARRTHLSHTPATGTARHIRYWSQRTPRAHPRIDRGGDTLHARDLSTRAATTLFSPKTRDSHVSPPRTPHPTDVGRLSARTCVGACDISRCSPGPQDSCVHTTPRAARPLHSASMRRRARIKVSVEFCARVSDPPSFYLSAAARAAACVHSQVREHPRTHRVVIEPLPARCRAVHAHRGAAAPPPMREASGGDRQTRMDDSRRRRWVATAARHGWT